MVNFFSIYIYSYILPVNWSTDWYDTGSPLPVSYSRESYYYSVLPPIQLCSAVLVRFT